MRSRLALAALLPVLGGLLVALPATGQTPPVCAEPQQATSFTADGRPAPYRGIGCTVRTGFLTGETHLRVAPNGTVVQQPAQIVPGVAGTGFAPGTPGPKPQQQLTPGAFAVSRDGGKRFERVLPAGQEWVASDGSIYIDAVTGRLYFYALSPAVLPQGGGVAVTDQVPAGYAHLLTSADDGRTWFHTQAPGYVESENPRFTSGPVPRGGDKPVPGEQVAYWCGNTVLFAYGQRDCYRTLDGGQTWQFRSTLLRRGYPVHAECGSTEETFNSDDGDYPSVGPDGSLWTLVHCGTSTFLARSTDEGLTFPVVRKGATAVALPAMKELRVDSRGTLYGASVEGTKLLLRTSRDGGHTWSAPTDLVSPAHRGAALTKWWAFAVRGPGQVAAAYLTGRKDGGYDGSVTVTHNALAPRPVLIASTVYDGKRALVASPQSAKDDYIDLDVAPDGTAWASFFGDCNGDPACAGSSPNPLAKVAVLTRLR